MILVNHYAVRPLIPKTIFIIMAFPFVLFHRDRFFNFYCLFCQQFSAAYLLKLFLLPQCLRTALFIRCDKPELTRWCLCSLYAGIQMSPDEVVGSCDGCCHSIPESTVDVPICLFLMKSGEYISPDFWLRESNPSREARSQEANH